MCGLGTQQDQEDLLRGGLVREIGGEGYGKGEKTAPGGFERRLASVGGGERNREGGATAGGGSVPSGGMAASGTGGGSAVGICSRPEV